MITLKKLWFNLKLESFKKNQVPHMSNLKERVMSLESLNAQTLKIKSWSQTLVMWIWWKKKQDMVFWKRNIICSYSKNIRLVSLKLTWKESKIFHSKNIRKLLVQLSKHQHRCIEREYIKHQHGSNILSCNFFFILNFLCHIFF